jgi:hypothetical protein
MARRKRSSRILDKAQRRIAGLKSIDLALNLGNGLTIQSFLTLIEETRQKLEAYNTALSMVDQTYNNALEAERSLSELSERMLIGVASKYGKSSNEYEMAGGARRYDRRRVSQSTDSSVGGSVGAA